MTVGTAGFASRIANLRPGHWYRLHDTPASGTQIADSVVLNTQQTTIIAFRGAIAVRQTGPLQASQLGYSMKFDGVSDAIEIANSAAILTGTSGTLVAFYKRTTAGTAGTIIGGFLSATNRECVVGINTTGAPYIRNAVDNSNASTTTATSNFSDDTAWHMLVITCDGSSTPIIYIDGVACTASQTLVGSAAAGSWFSYGNNAGAMACDIGRRGDSSANDGDKYFKGNLAEIATISSVMSAADVTALYSAATVFVYADALSNFNDMLVEKYWFGYGAGQQPALTSYASLDDASGVLTNNGEHGDTASNWSVSNGTYSQTGSGLDVISKAVSFSGVSVSGVTIGSAGKGRYLIYSDDTKGAVFWVGKLSSSQTQSGNLMLWMVKGDAGNSFLNYNGLFISTSTNQLNHVRSKQTAGNSRIRTSSGLASLFDNNYHFIAVTQRADGTNVHIFVDGVEVTYAVDTVAGTPPTVDDWSQYIVYGGGTSWLMLGGAGGTTCVTGALDHFSVVSNADVPASDVLALQNARSRTVSSSNAISTLHRTTRRRLALS